MLNTAGGAGWIRVQGTKILHATQPKKRSPREDLYVALEKGWPTCVESDGRSCWSVETQREGWCQALPVTRQAFVSASWGLAVQLKGKVGACLRSQSTPADTADVSRTFGCSSVVSLTRCPHVLLCTLGPEVTTHLHSDSLISSQ